MWTSGHVDKWTCGHVDKWTCGQVDMWTCENSNQIMFITNGRLNVLPFSRNVSLMKVISPLQCPLYQITDSRALVHAYIDFV